MTEQEWLTSLNPWDMIDFVGPGASARKLRLFGCACCRQVLNPFAPPMVLRVVQAAEAFADGEISANTLARVREIVAEAAIAADREDPHGRMAYFSYLFQACLSICHPGNVAELAQDASHATASAAAGGHWSQLAPAERFEERGAQAELFRDIFGNPFRSSELRPEWLTSTVVALAQGIYADYAFEGMPILADALQDAGCDDEGILSHCREPREHARGCWVVDLLLGKQ
jgi:hypothetical protein